jgi:hypothetical protein
VGSSILVDSDTVMGVESTVYTIEAEDSTISVALVSSVASCSIGDSVVLSATVLDDDVAVEGGTVTFKLGNSTLGTDETDSSGVATYTYTTTDVGSLNFTALYESHNSNTVSVVVSHDYSIAFDSSSYTTSTGDVTAYVTLLDNSVAVSGASISLTGTGSTLSATTNSSGVATFNLTGISADCTITATYENVSDTATVTVGPSYLFYDDASTSRISEYSTQGRQTITYDSNGYYTIAVTSQSCPNVKINSFTAPNKVKISLDMYIQSGSNAQPKIYLFDESKNKGYGLRVTNNNNKWNLQTITSYTDCGNNLKETSLTISKTTWYTLEVIIDNNDLTGNIYNSGGTLLETITSSGNLNLSSTGNYVAIGSNYTSDTILRVKNIKVEAL